MERIENMDVLMKYGTDLTMLAEMGKLDPVIGREREMTHIIQILLKRRKNNACLVGDAGVGKTAIVEGLAIKIASNSVPDQLKGKRIFSIDIASILAGAIIVGEFEDRMTRLVEQVRASDGRVILFIDELHTLIRFKGNPPDVASILKPALARGDLRCIGATTHEEYTRCIDKDAALKRRFQSIHVLEPSRDGSIIILEQLIHKYQTHHNVTYTQNALISAVDLSIHYIKEFLLPDKAIDLIDEAGAIAQLYGQTHITEAEIEYVVSACTGIPMTQISRKESQYLLELEGNLRRSVIGQDEAVAAVCRAIIRARVGIRDGTKPIGCFLFTGPTGVGKTEMAKVFAREYFGSEEAMVRLDMSEFMEYHNVSRLIGSPPSYIDHDEGGQLTEAVRRWPHSVVLFDEIEKAHEKVLNLLLQILDDGRLTDGKGNTIDFTNTIVVLTSNVATSQLKHAFKAELLNRFDQVVVFKPLKKDHMEKILEIMLDDFRARVASKKDIQVEVSEKLKETLISKGYNESYGARALKRTITSLVEDKLAEEILNGRVVERGRVTMDVDMNGEVVCHIVSEVKDYELERVPFSYLIKVWLCIWIWLVSNKRKILSS